MPIDNDIGGSCSVGRNLFDTSFQLPPVECIRC